LRILHRHKISLLKGVEFNQMAHVKILSDYTSGNQPNLLHILGDEQGDIHIWVTKSDPTDRTVRIAASGTRHSHKVREAFNNLIAVYQEELKTTNQALLRAMND
jgi:hypothetical protein